MAHKAVAVMAEPALLGVASYSGSTNSAVVDLQGTDHVTLALAIGAVSGSGAITFAVEESDSAGSGFAAVTDGSLVKSEADADSVFYALVDTKKRKRYLRVALTVAATSALASMVALKDNLGVSNKTGLDLKV